VLRGEGKGRVREDDKKRDMIWGGEKAEKEKTK